MSESKVVPASEEVTELKRGIRGWQVAFIGLGGVIGSCYFLGLGLMIRDMGPAVILAFAVVGLIVYGLMIAYAELLVNLPRKGSFVAYINEFLGGTVSVGFGWAFWFNWVAYVPSEAIAVSIVLNALKPGNQAAYAIGALAALTIINLAAVDIFAKIESGLAITKVVIIGIFIIAAFGIWVGLWGSDGFLGAQVNFASGINLTSIFPRGFFIVFTSMVLVLVTFQGTEIVGLAAAESQDPDKSVPKACKSVTYRIIGLYILPILLIILIFPTGQATIEDSVFAQVTNYYGLSNISWIMTSVVLVAAFSCANTGFYGTVRCMFGLSVEGLAPKFLSKLNKNANPKNAVFFTLAFMWLVLMLGLFASESSIYENLLSLSGFTGTVAWVGIIASQILFRKRLRARGYDPSTLKAAVKKNQRWLPWFAMIAQLACLVIMAFGEGQLFVFFIACGAIFLPMVVFQATKRMGLTRDISMLSSDEKSFDELFPPKGKLLDK